MNSNLSLNFRVPCQSFATVSPNRHFEFIQVQYALSYVVTPIGATRLRNTANTKKAKPHDIRPAASYHCSPEAAFTHLDEGKTVDSVIYRYVVGVAFLFLNLGCLLRVLLYRPIQVLRHPPTSKMAYNHITLLSSRDPLSLPIISINSNVSGRSLCSHFGCKTRWRGL